MMLFLFLSCLCFVQLDQVKQFYIHGSSDEGDYRSLTIEGGGVYFLWGVGVEVFSTNFQFFLTGFFPAARYSSQECLFWISREKNKDKNSRFGSEPVVQAENQLFYF